MDTSFHSDRSSLVTGDGSKSRKLGTFMGVFTPVCLAMFSAILFLRLGFILGNAGLLKTLAQMFISYNILVFTVLSVSAVSTNGAVEGGGIYFMSSRVLGPEFGGAIGVLFFVANIVSSAYCLTGCVEGLMNNFGPKGRIANFLPDGAGMPFTYASLINFMNLIICIFGAAIFAKATLIIFAIVVTTAISVILSFIFMPAATYPVPEDNLLDNISRTANFTGLNWETFKSNLYSNYTIDYTTKTTTSFASIFGVFFTGLTGVLAGANISGDLKNPGRSIPLGTLSGIACTFVVYATMFILSAATCSRELLQNNYLYMQYTNIWPPMVEIGISCATISAALTNLIGATRLMNAVARDRLFGWLLDSVYKINKRGNPIGSVILTWFMIQMMLFIGSFNEIAQISSILFLFTYFSLNLSCMTCILTSAPNFRPSFKYYNLVTTIIGLIGASGMTFVINTLYSSMVIIVWLILMIAIHVRSPNVHGGYITQALIFHQVRKYLLLLDHRKEHVKFWRPRVLLMVENPRTSLPLIEFVNDLKKSGLFVLGHVQVGNLDEFDIDPMLDQYPNWLHWLDQFTVKAFIEMTLAPSVREGMHHIARIAGLGAMKLNTVIFGFYDDAPPIDLLRGDYRYQALEQIIDESATLGLGGQHSNSTGRNDLFKIRQNGRLSRKEYVAMISDAMRKLQKIVCLARNYQLLDTKGLGKKDFGKFYIDIWPVNFFNPNEMPDNCANLIMQFACILNMVNKWKISTTIRLIICSSLEDQGFCHEHWTRHLSELRIEAELIMVVHEPPGLIRPSNSAEPFVLGSSDDSKWAQVDSEYVKSLNRMIVAQSQLTAVTFMYLPQAPRSSVYYDGYMNYLELLTENLPPTLLVYGHDQVISTSL